MNNYSKEKQALDEDGFVILNSIFSLEEIQAMLNIIETISSDKPSFRKAKNLFAIRQFLLEIPQIHNLLFTNYLCEIIHQFFGNDYFVVKSIYFDKPPESNWFVSYHRDITIAVNKKIELEGFSSWTVKQEQFAVQPPIDLLENNFTIRIHLDDTDKNNGALKVIPASHKKGIRRQDSVNRQQDKEKICEVNKGGIMLMRPLLLHASGKTINCNRRRVIHIEFSNCNLPLPLLPLRWSEYMNYKT